MKVCKECGQSFAPTGNRQEYCSKKCQREHERHKESRIKYIEGRNKRANTYKDDMLIVYQCKCAICGWQATPIVKKDKKEKYDLQKGCEIHHIVPVSEGGTDDWDNLIMLCPNHHKMADKGIIEGAELSKYVKPRDATEEQISATLTSENVAYFRTHRSSFQNTTLDEIVDAYNKRSLLFSATNKCDKAALTDHRAFDCSKKYASASCMDIECELEGLMDNVTGAQQSLIYEAIRRIGTLDYILGILEAKEKAQ